MYKITFFDVNKTKLATHFINADFARLDISHIISYCQMVAGTYSEVMSWKIAVCNCTTISRGDYDSVSV